MKLPVTLTKQAVVSWIQIAGKGRHGGENSRFCCQAFSTILHTLNSSSVKFQSLVSPSILYMHQNKGIAYT
jgi:hypothetical protein